MGIKPFIKDYSLYLITSEEYSAGRTTFEIARSAISGGIDILQMREKNKSRDELVKLGKELSGLCKKGNITFIVNDDPFIAKETGADGIHLGQEDIKKHTLKGVREIVGEDKIIGVSTHSLRQFEVANRADVDYVAFGPIFPTKTKDYWLGTRGIDDVLRVASKPVIFIGGIALDNIDKVLSKGAKNVALIRGIVAAEDVEIRTGEFKNRIVSYKGNRNDN